MPMILDYTCTKTGCKITFEEWFMERMDEYPRNVPCPECRGIGIKQVSKAYNKVIVRGNSDFVEREKARLTQRSTDHWNRTGKEEARYREHKQFKNMGLFDD